MIETPIRRLQFELEELARQLDACRAPLPSEVVHSLLVSCVRSMSMLAHIVEEIRKEKTS